MELRTEIEIEAPPDRVWAVLTDFESYPEWNPFIASFGGELTEGGELSIELTPPESDSIHLRSTLVRVEQEREIRFRGHFFVRGLFDGEHFFQLIPIADEKTRFVQGEDFTGILVKFMNRALTARARGFALMNLALRRRVMTK
jgi:hypothetical protein